MSQTFLRKQLRDIYTRSLRLTANELKEDQLTQPAIIFSPHQDDETLGCGGTIIKKRRAGAGLKIVFMTDGSNSHPRLISREELVGIRHKEALLAGEKLGVEETNVIFLGFEDRNLRNNQDVAIEKVKEILFSYQPAEVFVPYYKEKPADHHVTNSIVISALHQCKFDIIINEYPIWFWMHWPWTGQANGQQNDFSYITSSIRTDWGYLLRDFKHYVSIKSVLELKRTSLAQYRSQMTRLIPDPGWSSLVEVSNGEFLACFFQKNEIFYRYRLSERFPNR